MIIIHHADCRYSCNSPSGMSTVMVRFFLSMAFTSSWLAGISISPFAVSTTKSGLAVESSMAVTSPTTAPVAASTSLKPESSAFDTVSASSSEAARGK